MIKAMTSKCRIFNNVVRLLNAREGGGLAHLQRSVLQVWMIKVRNHWSAFKTPRRQLNYLLNQKNTGFLDP